MTDPTPAVEALDAETLRLWRELADRDGPTTWDAYDVRRMFAHMDALAPAQPVTETSDLRAALADIAENANHTGAFGHQTDGPRFDHCGACLARAALGDTPDPEAER